MEYVMKSLAALEAVKSHGNFIESFKGFFPICWFSNLLIRKKYLGWSNSICVFQNSCRKKIQKWSQTEDELKQKNISLPFGVDWENQNSQFGLRNPELPDQLDSNRAELAVQPSHNPQGKNRTIRPILKVCLCNFAILIQWRMPSLPQQWPHTILIQNKGTWRRSDKFLGQKWTSKIRKFQILNPRTLKFMYMIDQQIWGM